MLNDFNGNELVTYIDNNEIFVSKCVQINEIILINKTNGCFEDIPIITVIANKSVNAFLTTDNIIKINSKIVNCKSNKKIIFLKDTNQLITMKGDASIIESAEKYIQIEFNLRSVNITQLNYYHDPFILTVLI